MKSIHIPNVNARYWCAIAMASLFGTNLGDLWAHNSGLHKLVGLIPLALLAAVVFALERRDRAPRELYYWLVIAIIRTGATNIADYFKKVISWPVFGAILAVLMIGTALWSLQSLNNASSEEAEAERHGMPQAGTAYWCAMLTAGVLGTFYGDVAWKAIGMAPASLALGILLLGAIGLWSGLKGHRFWLYWLVVAIARTFGTAAGDFLAEDPMVGLDLVTSTLITGAVFVGLLATWRGGKAVPLREAA
ncbi:hypothetical protein P1X14_13550 [Sphingomonas sp. AOB5]|uniref:hypothetical protein n=1 Tax=Sphingomonas sp. AOB5 TaxID=3034017 RepID=UPI0023F6657D|nr:hypothetical protein [Sphingomonas sp. AOB5]MDF7776276.1 hypothetical protein [Sphingomonas sp. AOB5]